MTNRTIPTRIVHMVNTRLVKGHNAKCIAKSINDSATAQNLGVEYSSRSIAAIMANLTRGSYI